MMVESKLKAGVIFGDTVNQEYVYMPGSEVGMAQPICVYESEGSRADVDMQEALRLVRVRSLRPAKHPLLGDSSC
ncbi:hypothetical protein FZ041_01915 [Selenomonas caprae]|uniref:Uncharacterized protein n=2 Tax=Selenomonas TaxID=970 RepID=A0A1I3BM73_SELRU|nr:MULTISPECIES: hypothetical protein [Selenomonas]TYZ30452.1 hypothetical protein FZ041_01915 [Selenomonas caprae]SFH63395.1 hypothetical protein SAMN04487861_10184 [Selenomonas ruminantium]